jgi:hypothetical protein
MHLKKLIITNYKGFLEPTTFEFKPGFNILLGANSSGKTSVLEAVDIPTFQGKPHLSLLNCPEVGNWNSKGSSSEVTFSLTLAEIKSWTQRGVCTIDLRSVDGNDYPNDQIKHQLASELIELGLLSTGAGQEPSFRLHLPNWPTHWIQSGTNSGTYGVSLQGENYTIGPQLLSGQHTPWLQVKKKIYRFSAERRVSATSGHTPGNDLQSDLQNLAFCLNLLQSTNPTLYDNLNGLLKRVFPTIHGVYAPPYSNGMFELRVHFNEQRINRGDLSVPINEVGTGVANAIGMLYIALTSQSERVILLEEPNSYLHPRALRELLAILVEYGSKHQYFVTTHSSDVLRAVDASSVTLLSNDGTQTSQKQIFDKKLHSFSAGLTELGITLTDLHGCDKILWVEGHTEEAVFPLLLRHFFADQAQGIACLPLYATGDFDARRYKPTKVASIYKTLSEGNFLAPPLVAIVLDSESRSSTVMKQLENDSDHVIQFLPKVMLENYILDAEAITSVLNEELAEVLKISDVQKALNEALANPKNKLKPQSQKSEEHAAKVLETVFQQLGQREYQKTSHGPKLFKWIIREKPNELTGLKDFLSKIVNKAV